MQRLIQGNIINIYYQQLTELMIILIRQFQVRLFFITAWNAPPTAAPKQAVRNGFPSGNVTPYNNGSPIPKKPTGNAPLITLRSRLFFCFHIDGDRSSYLPSSSHC